MTFGDACFFFLFAVVAALAALLLLSRWIDRWWKKLPAVMFATLTCAAPGWAQTVADATAKIECGPSSGSAVHLRVAGGKTVLVTCRHVVGARRECVVRFPSGKTFAGAVLALGTDSDLALVRADVPAGVPSVALSPRAPEVGEAVWLVGYPRGAGPNCRKGAFRGYIHCADKYTRSGYAATTVVSTGGDSGGGFYRADGTLCGILSMGYGQVSQGNGPTWHQLKALVEKHCGLDYG